MSQNSTLEVIPIYHFPLMIVIALALTSAMRWAYIKFSTQISEKQHFSLNFIYLALIVLLIISVVKSSLALSLGLVGALSIVRFRTAIKNPEELIFLFLSIGIGVGLGAGKVYLVVTATVVFCLHSYFCRQGINFFGHPLILSRCILNRLSILTAFSRYKCSFFLVLRCNMLI